MNFKNAYIPYGCYWSTPFCRWQGSFQKMHTVEFAARITTGFLQERNISPKDFDELIFGVTVPQLSVFFGTPWLAGLIGAGRCVTMISSAIYSRRSTKICWVITGPKVILASSSSPNFNRIFSSKGDRSRIVSLTLGNNSNSAR